MSSKLSNRRSTARKPSICISGVIPPIFSTTKINVRIVWIQTEEPPTVIHVDEIVLLTRIPVSDNLYEWDWPNPGPDRPTHVELAAPLDADWNSIIFSCTDHYDYVHYSENYFQPSRPVPFTQDVPCVSYDYPDPVDLRAILSPVLA